MRTWSFWSRICRKQKRRIIRTCPTLFKMNVEGNRIACLLWTCMWLLDFPFSHPLVDGPAGDPSLQWGEPASLSKLVFGVVKSLSCGLAPMIEYYGPLHATFTYIMTKPLCCHNIQNWVRLFQSSAQCNPSTVSCISVLIKHGLDD